MKIFSIRMGLVFLQFGLIPPMILFGLQHKWSEMFAFAAASLIVAKINLSLMGVARS